MTTTHNAGRISEAQHTALRLLAARLGRKKTGLIVEALETFLTDHLSPYDLIAHIPHSADKEAGKIPAAMNMRLKEKAIRLGCSKEFLVAYAIGCLLVAYKDHLE